jgi:hypothetical protein
MPAGYRSLSIRYGVDGTWRKPNMTPKQAVPWRGREGVMQLDEEANSTRVVHDLSAEDYGFRTYMTSHQRHSLAYCDVF